MYRVLTHSFGWNNCSLEIFLVIMVQNYFVEGNVTTYVKGINNCGFQTMLKYSDHFVVQPNVITFVFASDPEIKNTILQISPQIPDLNVKVIRPFLWRIRRSTKMRTIKFLWFPIDHSIFANEERASGEKSEKTRSTLPFCF